MQYDYILGDAWWFSIDNIFINTNISFAKILFQNCSWFRLTSLYWFTSNKDPAPYFKLFASNLRHF